jgi:macrolide transport system ATP-binding/permease protein
MASFVRFLRKMQLLFGRQRFRDELNEEMEFHRAAAERALVDEGMTPEGARYAARRQFGNVTRMNEQSHEVVGFRIETIAQDIAFAMRQLRKNPGFAMTAILTLALGIGANTAIFTLVHAVLLKNLPVLNPKALVRVGDNEGCCNLNLASTDSDYTIFSYDGYKYLRDHTPDFEQLAAVQAGGVDLSVRRSSGDITAHSSLGEFVSGNYFATFGIEPYAGRVIMPSDDADGAPPVAVLSYRAWQRDYAGDPSVIGSTFVMNTHPMTIIGVTPRTFYGDRMTEEPRDFYIPISQEPTLGFYAVRNRPAIGWLFLIGRVKPGTAIAPLQTKMSGLLRQSLSQLPSYQDKHGREHLAQAHVVLTPGGAGIANMQHQTASSLWLLMGLSGLVLLIACANIANLMLVRGLARRVETSIRMALGAGRTRIARQMVTECVVLACLGGLAGLGLAYVGTKSLLALMFPDSPNVTVHATPSLPVLGFAFGISLVTGVIFGVAPAWITSREKPANAMRCANRATRDRTSLLQRSLVILQTALSLVLLVGAGLLGKSLNKLEHQDFGLETDGRVIVSLNPLKAGYKPGQLPGLYQQMEDKFQALPGIKRVGLTLYTPLEGNSWSFYVFVQGLRPPNPGQELGASFNRASPDYFQAVGQRIVRGRAFNTADTASAPSVAVVNEAFVKRNLKPGEDPIGQHFGAEEIKNSGDFEIVGVVEDSKYISARDAVEPMYFTPLLQQSRTSPHKDVDASLYIGALVLQTKGMVPDLEAQVRKTLASIDPNLTVDHYQTFAQQIDGNFNAERMTARLTLLFGLLALALASVGLYGVTSYAVARSTPEIGIRMALGADRRGVIGMVMRGALLQAAIGVAIGIPTALVCVRFVKSQLYDMAGYDLPVMAGAVFALAIAAGLAAMIPAQRAASVNPVDALRAE